MTELGAFLLSLAMPLMMVLICAVNLFVTHRRSESRLSLDGKRLETALVEELRLLARLYRSNLKLLENEELRLISTRMPLAVFRGNVGRITLLEEESIRRVIAVHGNNEHIEMMVSERAKSIKNGQCTVYIFEKGEHSFVHFRELFMESLELVKNAIVSLEGKRPASELASPSWESNSTVIGNIGRSLGFVDL